MYYEILSQEYKCVCARNVSQSLCLAHNVILMLLLIKVVKRMKNKGFLLYLQEYDDDDADAKNDLMKFTVKP